MSLAVTGSDAALGELLDGIRAGRTGALARAISWAENGEPGAEDLLDALHADTGRAWRTGITGPPGAGKSTLADALCRAWAGAGRRTALLAVDPSSPFSGGALLGDRVRMDRALSESGVYVRSMANRGSLGGLALAAGAAADLLDAFGFAEVLLETVGVGQAEVDIAAAADVTLVVLTPHSGDGVQAMKAGLTEVADLFVVNKADAPGADRIKHELEAALELRPDGAPPVEVVCCSALHGDGLDELGDAIERKRAAEESSGRLARRRRDRALARVKRLVVEELRARVWASPELLERARVGLAGGRAPERLARELVEGLLEREGGRR